MDSFIQKYTDKLLVYKKNVFTYTTAKEFIDKQTKIEEIEKVKVQLNKCLFPNNKNLNQKEDEARSKFINDFITELIELKKRDIYNKTPISNVFIAKISNANTGFQCKKPFKIVDYDKDFPTLQNLDLLERKNKLEVLPHHYKNTLDKGVKLCNCLRSKHPLVGNCLKCGKIQCLQEGSENCIVCGTKFEKKETVLKECNNNSDLLKAHEHKEKLLKFQKDFYSKLQIIDDYSDWYELAGNCWLDPDQRRFAKDKEEESKKIKDDPEWQYSVNFITGEINIEYQKIDDNKQREEIANMFINQFNNNNDK